MSDDLSSYFNEASDEICEVAFLKLKDMQIRWKRKNGILYIWISDYLEGTPENVMCEFAKSVIRGIKTKVFEYGPEYMNWVTSTEFILKNRPLYLRRSKNIRREHKGSRDLMDSVQRLLDAGYLSPSDIDLAYFSWTTHPNYRKYGYCSPMFRTVAISSALERADVPEDVLDYVVYHECLHLRQGYRPSKRSHDSAFRKEENKYPHKEEYNTFLINLKGQS